MRVLIFGFSVTGDTPGYVEFWQKTYAKRHPTMSLTKIAIGGLQPTQGRHVASTMILRYRPNIVIFEISTPVYRLLPATEGNIKEHIETVNFLVRLCAESSIRCGFLDLPQKNLVERRDWMGDIHRVLLEIYGVPLVSVGLVTDTLRDNVHPNDSGRQIYADALERLLEETLKSSSANYHHAKSEKFFDAIHVADVERSAGELVGFERNGFTTRMLKLAARQAITLNLSRPETIVGVIVAMGPATGYMDIRINGTEEIICCYDVHCYYQRVGARMFSPRKSNSVVVVQGNVMPDIVPQKGSKYMGERVGGITHLLYQKKWM